MDRKELALILKALRDGQMTPEDVEERLSPLAEQKLDYAMLDHMRAERTGVPEVVFCRGKTPQQSLEIIKRIWEREGRVLATRAGEEVAKLVSERYPFASYHPLAGVIMLGQPPERNDDPFALIATAGSSDIPVAEEAALTLQFLNNPVRRIFDVGVAGIHRLFNYRDLLDNAGVIIAVAGMEGALASVIGGLVNCPVIAVPTSIGYGASFGGLAALLAMLNSCAPGVVVTNIDNGFGAAVHAHHILQGRKQ